MRRASFPLMALLFYVIAIAYPIVRVWSWYQPGSAIDATVAFMLMVAFLVMPPALFVRRIILRKRIPDQLMHWFYVVSAGCFLLFPVTIALEIARWVPGFPVGSESVIAIASSISLTCYAALNARRVKVKTLQIDNQAQLAGKSIVQLSDVHIGSRSTAYLDSIVDEVLNLNPTHVVITGDLLDSSSVGPQELAPLRRIADRTLMVTGNHERYEGIERVTTMLESIGITLLRNKTLDAAPFQFIGVDDHDSPEFLRARLAELEPDRDAFRVLLYHRPHGMESAAAWGADLMLVGHTHRGQVFPFQLVVKRFFELIHGTHRFGNMTLHISSGTGTWGPILRLGSRNEITHVVFG